MEFLPDITKWTQALLRWGHVFFAILWVGTSFTFNYLDNKLPKNLKAEDAEAEEAPLSFFSPVGSLPAGLLSVISRAQIRTADSK